MCFENIDKKRQIKFLLHSLVHSRHNESLICANIQYICISVHTWKISNNRNSRWNHQCLSPGWLVGWLVGWGQIDFVSYRSPHGVGSVVGLVVHEYSLERGWGHDVGRGQRGSQVANNFLGNPKVFPSPVVYDGVLLLDKYKIQENLYKGKIVCCVPTVLNHHSIPAIVLNVDCPHLYSNVERGHEKQGGHLVQTLSRGR